MTQRELSQTIYTLKSILDNMAQDFQFATELSDEIENFDVAEFDKMGVRLQELHDIMC